MTHLRVCNSRYDTMIEMVKLYNKARGVTSSPVIMVGAKMDVLPEGYTEFLHPELEQ